MTRYLLALACAFLLACHSDGSSGDGGNNGDGSANSDGGTDGGGAPGCPAPRPQLLFGQQVFSLVGGDFNHDGKLDIAALAEDTNATDMAGGEVLKVALGRGDGTFEPPTLVETESGIGPLFAADVDKDGRDDLLVVTSTNMVRVLLSNADGTFQTAVPYPLGSAWTACTVGDFTGDNVPDLACAGMNVLFVLPADGLGGFKPFVATPFSMLMPVALTAADVDGDTHLDLVVATTGTSNQVVVYKNNGSAMFTTSTAFANSASVSSLAMGDFDGDGKLDLFATNGTYSWVYGSKDDMLESTDNSVTRQVAAADLDGDGKLDMIGLGDSLWAGHNLGTGLPDVLRRYQGSLRTTSQGLVIGDLDGDKVLDVVVIDTETGEVLVHRGIGGGVLDGERLVALPPQATVLAIGDLNGDAKQDIVVSLSAGIASILSTSTGEYSRSDAMMGAGHAGTAAAIGDIDGDGANDVVVANGANLDAYTGAANGQLTYLRSYPIGGSPQEVSLFDLNGDGKLDAVLHATPYIFILLGNGNGYFQASVMSTTLGGSPYAIGDLNGDGALDAVFAAPNGSISVSLQQAQMFPMPTVYMSGIKVLGLAVCDFDGDKRADVAVAGPMDGAVVLRSSASGALSGPMTFDAGEAPNNLACGDLDGDGLADIVGVIDHGITIVHSSGAAFGAASRRPTMSASNAFVRDFDGDGHNDVIVQLPATASPSTYLGYIPGPCF